MTSLVINVPGEYISLGLVMQSALEQASKGKGWERHASEGEAYEDQIICEVARRVGLGYPLGQAVKKIYESQRLIPQLGVQELLGAMNYLAAAVIVMQERMEEEGRRFREGFANAKTEDGCCQNGNDQQEFKPGDKVQYHVTLPSVSDGMWVDAEYDGKLTNGREHTVKTEKLGLVVVDGKDIRPALKAEGCEALVEKDAPQTPQELYQHIVDCNPATFHTPSYAEEQLDHHSRLQTRKPTGEELAEMAEEEEKHG